MKCVCYTNTSKLAVSTLIVILYWIVQVNIESLNWTQIWMAQSIIRQSIFVKFLLSMRMRGIWYQIRMIRIDFNGILLIWVVWNRSIKRFNKQYWMNSNSIHLSSVFGEILAGLPFFFNEVKVLCNLRPVSTFLFIFSKNVYRSF